MQPDLLTSLRRLSDAELLARVGELAASERSATALLIAHLAELDTRDAHLRAGHGSLFTYCRDVLGLAEQEAYNRIAVARTARRFPVVLELLESGALHLTAVRLLGPHLTPANHLEVLRQARGKTKVQLEEMAAALWPRPDVPSFVRKLPARPQAPPVPETRSPAEVSPDQGPSPIATPVAGLASSSPGDRRGTPSEGRLDTSAIAGGSAGGPAGPPIPPPPARRTGEVTPLAPDRYKVQVTIGSETLEKLRLAQDLLRHAVPSGDEAQILDRALTALLAQLAQRKLAATDQPRPGSSAAPGSRHVPAEIRRAVWARDQGRCAFVARSGRRCPEHALLEFHHVVPYSLGGEATTANIQLRCRSHNAYEARQYFASARAAHGVQRVRERARAYGEGAAPLAGGSRHASATRSGTSRGAAATRRRLARNRAGP